MSDLPAAKETTHEAWIGRVLEEFQRPLLSYVYKILGDATASQDVVQDTFLKLCQQDRDRVSVRLKSWLFTVARNGALDQLRRRKRTVFMDVEAIHAMPSEERAPDELAALQDSLEGIEGFLDRLSENQREVVRLKFQFGLSYKEIAETTGLQIGNVGFLLHAALKRLREMMSHRFG